MDNKFFMHRIRRTSGTIDKGIEVWTLLKRRSSPTTLISVPMPTGKMQTQIM